jgi:hypothetical protein
MPEKPVKGFSLSYFLFGGGLADWLRPLGDDARRLLIYGLIGCVIYVGVTHFFPRKPQGNVNTPEGNQSVVLTPGTKVDHITQSFTSTNTQKVEEKKRPWFMPIPYIAGYGEVRSKDSGLSDYDVGIGAQVGLRLDFN